jgi:glycerol kinase
VEHEPSALLESIQTCLAATADDLGDRVFDLRAAGLATQRSSVVCWDRCTGRPLSQVISWRDRRGEDQVRSLRRHNRQILEISGLVLSSHYGASKIRWCLDHLPEVREALGRGRLACGPLASYLIFHLCDRRLLVVDPAVASRTLLWDLKAADWSPRLLKIFGVPRIVLPECVPSRRDFGRIQTGAATVPLTTSTGDQSAAFFANGLLPPDFVSVNLGTGAFVQRRLMSEIAPDSRLLKSIVWHDSKTPVQVLEGSINGCGSALTQMGAELGIDTETVIACAKEWLEESISPPLFLNGVSGLGSPYWVADYPSQWVGSGEPWQMMVAVLESIVFLLRINLEEMDRELGPPKGILVSGGPAALDGLCQRLASLSGIEILRSKVHEATSQGLARLISDQLDVVPTEGSFERFLPLRDPLLETRFQRWRGELEARLPTVHRPDQVG